MSLKSRFPSARLEIAVLFLAFWLPHARAAPPTLSILNSSIKPVDLAPTSGAVKPHRPFISRTTLQANEVTASMSFDVVLKMRNFAELQARVNRGEHVSPQEMASKYEPLPSDYQAVANWLTSKGLTITRHDSHHMAIFVRGSVGQVRSAMQVTFARVSSEGKEYTSAVTAPSVPATISSLLVGMNGLQPHIRAHKHLMKPNAGTGTATYTPAQIAQAYQATGLYSQGINGAGQTIAIVIDTFPSKDDLVEFWNAYGVNQSINNITFIQAVAGTLDAPSGEETLDTEWSSSIAPGAKVRVYAATDLGNDDLDAAYQQVYDDVMAHPEYGIHEMSMSYGLGEIETTYSQMDTDDQYFVELTNAGVTCFASSGDEGSTPGVDNLGDPDESGSLEPESPASDPNVIGVGGTTLTLDTSNNESTESVWNNSIGASGGGTSGHFSRPSWQTGTGVPAATTPMRLVPDISCSADPNYGADTIYQGAASAFGGTSWACPTCAAFCALTNQARANLGLSSLGQLGPHIYPLIGSSSFRDITGGSNATSSSGGHYGATAGYDEASGIGVPLVLNLAEAVAGTTTLLAVTPQSTLLSINQAQNAVIAVTATGSPVSYQWQRKAIGTTTWSNLSDNSTYSGSATASLTVNITTAAMSGDQFQCLVTYASTTLTSNPPCVLTVENPWTVSTLAGVAGVTGLVDTASGTPKFDYPTGIAIDSAGNLYITDLYNNAIRKVTSAGVVSTPYGSTTGVSGSTNATGNAARFYYPRDITGYTFGGVFYLYVSDEGNNAIRQINTSTGAVSTINLGSTTLSDPKGIGVDSSGDIFVADSENNVIRKIAATSGLVGASPTVSIFAGSSSLTAGYADGQGTTQALFNQPIGLAIDGSNNVYIADYGNEVIRKITSGGVVSTFAGQAGIAGCLDGTGTQALFNVARGITADSSGNLYLTDSYTPIVTQGTPTFSGNDILRKITPAGVVTTLAGQAGIAGTLNGTGNGAQFYNPAGLAMNSNGVLYITDASNDTIRAALLPSTTVSLTTPQPNASVVTAATGQFVVTRTGNTSTAVTASYSLSGTAVNGTDYETLPGTLTFPAGVTSETITVIPFLDPAVTSSRTAILTLTGPAGTVMVNPSANSGTVTIAELQPSNLVPLSQWESNYPNIASLNDGIPLLLKYLIDIDPSVTVSPADHAALPTAGMTTIGGNEYLTLTYRQYLFATGVTVTVQTSPDLQTWTTVDPPDLSQQIGVAPDGNPIMEVGVKTNGAPELFIRLNVTSP